MYINCLCLPLFNFAYLFFLFFLSFPLNVFVSFIFIALFPTWHLALILFSSLVQFSRSVVSDSSWSHESQHPRPPCPSPTPRVHSNSCPLRWWCHPAISSSVIPFSSCPQSLPASVFSNESTLRMRWPKYWSFSFSISPSSEHPGLISFRMGWLDLLAVQGTQESSPTPQFKSINSLVLSFLYSSTLTSIHDHWKNHSFD